MKVVSLCSVRGMLSKDIELLWNFIGNSNDLVRLALINNFRNFSVQPWERDQHCQEKKAKTNDCQESRSSPFVGREGGGHDIETLPSKGLKHAHFP